VSTAEKTGISNEVDLARRHRALERPPPADPAQHAADLETLRRQGYVVLERLLSEAELEAIRAESARLLPEVHRGRNDFEGLATQRVYNVLGRSTVYDRLVDHPRVMSLLDEIFMPNYLLSQAQIINILPGEAPQALHYDDSFYRVPRPRPAFGAATVWAIDEFTDDNGATAIVPGSHTWGDDRTPTRAEAIPARMPAGSCVLYYGTFWHGGGENRTDAARLGVTCQYCEPWLRQQENFLLELSRERVRELSPEIRSMVGYSIYPPFMGMVEGMHPLRLLEEDHS